jgi:hypothetical protein
MPPRDRMRERGGYRVWLIGLLGFFLLIGRSWASTDPHSLSYDRIGQFPNQEALCAFLTDFLRVTATHTSSLEFKQIAQPFKDGSAQQEAQCMRRAICLIMAMVGLGVAPLLSAQGRGSGGMQGGGRQGQGMQRGQSQAPGTAGQMGQQDRQRMRIHATQQQQQQYRTCTQSMDQVRSRVRAMARLTKGGKIDHGQMQQLRQQLRTELQTMQQEREQLTARFTNEQQAAVQNHVQEMNRSQTDLESYFEALGHELDQLSPNPDRVRDQVRNMDRASKELQQRQRDMAADAGIQ